MSGMSEAEFQGHIRSYCRDLGLLAYHTHDARRSDKGFPDLVVVGARGVLFRELKNDTYKPTREQVLWLEALQAAGADAALWRPSQLRTSVVAELSALGRIPRAILPPPKTSP